MSLNVQNLVIEGLKPVVNACSAGAVFFAGYLTSHLVDVLAQKKFKITKENSDFYPAVQLLGALVGTVVSLCLASKIPVLECTRNHTNASVALIIISVIAIKKLQLPSSLYLMGALCGGIGLGSRSLAIVGTVAAMYRSWDGAPKKPEVKK